MIFGSWTIKEVAGYTGANIGTVRSFQAEGKRGALYGCLVYDDGRFHWLNMKNGFAAVPFDLAQVNPLRLA